MGRQAGCIASWRAGRENGPRTLEQVDKLLQSALERPAAERDAFLRSACGGDEQLEHEVRSLLAAHERADSFLAVPAIELAARAARRTTRRR